ncbi:MAG: PfkB family carbohydrate kinase [Lachnospiraceae bacterium]|nr:PfkB family carbohydrate kinase [Lachnospiraceae bacterium]MCI1328579.1 PfkB family carbohydrate kinase [Lachnospiraceae bacterium]
MKKNIYDTMIIGPLSLDIMIDCHDHEDRLTGGAVIQSGYAAANIGGRTAVFTKLNPADADVYDAFKNCPADIYWKPSAHTTSIRNKYFTEDKETRECTLISKSDAFSFEEFPPVETKIYHFAGLTYGDFPDDLFEKAAGKGKVAVDVQCLLRHGEPDGSMKFYDWDGKKKYLPYIDFLKTDAAEAKILTGTDDRKQAAKILHDWGAKEVVITHNTEVLAYDGNSCCVSPIKARSLAGRTGRGDTTFAGYLVGRLNHSMKDALLFATALVSLKMETPGPFCGTREDVEQYIREFYTE